MRMKAAYCAGVCALLAAMQGPALAHITRIVIAPVQSPTFAGTTFGPGGAVGAYEKWRGTAYGEIDPGDPHNSLVTDIGLAPLNAAGRVQYSMDVYILKPVDLSRSNGKLFFEVNNRGNKLFGSLNGSGGGNDPTTAADVGSGFLLNQGYVLAWSGWDPVAAPGGNRLTIQVPIAHYSGGAHITGTSYEYIEFDNATTTSAAISYPAVSTDTAQAHLTVKQHLTDVPVELPPTAWQFTSPTSIALLPAGTAFQQSAIYELTYTAQDPTVSGIGFAATRDFISFLRHARTDDYGNPNPLYGAIKETLGYTVSQPARYLNDFVWLGFNEDENRHIVFDGIENWIGAGDGVALNFRFSQDGRTERNRQHHLYPEGNFPFAFATTHDEITGKTDGRAHRCTRSGTCPKFLEVISANEYWVKAGSTVHTDTHGVDLLDDDEQEDGKTSEVPEVRYYLLSGVEHTTSGAAPFARGVCQQYGNTTDPSPALRALLVDLDEWVALGHKPPRSAVPRMGEGNAVYSVALGNGLGVVPQDALGWPDIPGVTYSGLITVRHHFNWGPEFDQGILSNDPPAFAGPVYPSFVSKVDEDGNEIAGVHLPPVAVPVATTTGWALRAPAFGGPDGCESSGQWIPFAATKAERLASGDPRLSLEERYATHDAYVARVAKAATDLQRRRLLLPADAQSYINAAQAAVVP